MARRRKARTKTRTIYKKAKSYAKRKTSPTRANLVQPDAMIYGAIREDISLKTLEFANKSGSGLIGKAGVVADELIMGGLSYLAAIKGKGIVKNIGLKGLVVENARVGEIAKNAIFKGGMSNNSGGMYIN